MLDDATFTENVVDIIEDHYVVTLERIENALNNKLIERSARVHSAIASYKQVTTTTDKDTIALALMQRDNSRCALR